MVPQTPDKRIFPRTRLKQELRYQIRGTSDFDNAIVDDISMVGIGFTSDKFLAPETMVSMEIRILSKVLRPIGKIAWSLPLSHSSRYRVGIAFMEFDPMEKKYLADYVDMQLQNRG